jgi:hypothetical protein
MCPSERGFLLVPHLAPRRCPPAEVIDLVDDDSSEGTPVKRVAMKPKEKRKPKLVIVVMDDDASLETSQAPVIEIEDSSLGSMCLLWTQDCETCLKGTQDWETLTDTFDIETSSSVALAHFDNGSVIVTAGESLVWDGGSLSFLDGLKDSEMSTDFGDDDISAIAFQADSETDAVVPAPLGSIDADSLLDVDVDSFIDFQISSHRTIMALAPVDDLNRNATSSYLDRRTHMVSLDDEASCIVVQNEACAVAAPAEELNLDSTLLSFTFEADVVVPWDSCNEK